MCCGSWGVRGFVTTFAGYFPQATRHHPGQTHINNESFISFKWKSHSSCVDPPVDHGIHHGVEEGEHLGHLREIEEEVAELEGRNDQTTYKKDGSEVTLKAKLMLKSHHFITLRVNRGARQMVKARIITSSIWIS